MKRKILVGNWKMNKTIAEAIDNLDTSLKIEEESRIAQDDVIEANVGLAEDGSGILLRVS